MWLDSRKRPLIFAFWLVAYGRFDCSRIVDEHWRKKYLLKTFRSLEEWREKMEKQRGNDKKNNKKEDIDLVR